MLVLPVCRWLRPICRSRLTSRGAWELAAPGSWALRLSSAMKKGHFLIACLTGDLEDMVILDVMNDLILPKGIYPESLVLIS